MASSILIKTVGFLTLIGIYFASVNCAELQQSFEHRAESSLISEESWSNRKLFELEAKDKAISEVKEKNDVVDVDSNNIQEFSDHVKDTEITVTKLNTESSGFTHAFIASLSVIVVSELGDKTFFIAAIMAMKHSRVTVLIGALAALFFMTVLSALVGFATTVIPKAFTFYASSALFAIFGLKMLREGWTMSADEGQEEYEEVQADLKKRDDEMEKQKGPQDIETGVMRSPGRHLFAGILSTIFLQALTLTFLAEWGDRSQLATIILAAKEDVYGVIIGGCLGHTFCTGLAVVGGRFIAQRISIRTVTLTGGVVFLLFALSAFWIGP